MIKVELKLPLYKCWECDCEKFHVSEGGIQCINCGEMFCWELPWKSKDFNEFKDKVKLKRRK